MNTTRHMESIEMFEKPVPQALVPAQESCAGSAHL